MAFHDVRLSDEIEQGASGGPNFQTTVLPLSSGGEQRNIDWAEARHEWELGYGIDNKQAYDEVRQFFFARRGMAHTFRFKDWSDFQLNDEVIGLGDGTNRVFQIIRTYEADGPAPYFRRITRPVAGTVVFKVAGVTRAAVDNGLGVYTLATPAPALGVEVSCTCEFDMCVRFNVDKFNLTLTQVDAGQISSLPIIEVRE
jgi:uncharacterized protein (TIGR02217 family)